MAQRTYTDLEQDGYSYTLRVPSVLVPGEFGNRLRAVWPRMGQRTADNVVAGAVQAFAYPTMQAHFNPVVDVRGFSLVSGMSTNDPIFPFVEWDADAHWPPFFAGSPLAEWARRHNLSAYWTAKTISERGTTGKKAMPTILRQQVPAFLTALKAAVREAIDA